ncbi:CBS domain-containing protein [Candidatus Uabimicrobium amorphum]|uniref:CBS domain-containing protein n=1 Tax=Uabimicrobium amorphum TaxID=2596890 RepID=A0A5S9IIU5_UABAM|nr:CBS domain-containing protein [Candidatus Uabimicrobium amorphum]BBM82347.1 CBS domain-containing protein [Candidatus Uabimicrobium amorphum]
MLQVKDIMQTEIVVVNAHMTLRELSNIFANYHLTGLIVVDANERLAGVVSLRDLIEYSQKCVDIYCEEANIDKNFFYHDLSQKEIFNLDIEFKENTTVGQIMTPMMVCVDEEESVTKAAKIMLDAAVHRLLVTKNDNVVGIVSAMDMVGIVAREEVS